MRSELREHVLRLTLDRPEKRNTLDVATLDSLAAALATVHENPAIRCVRLASEGPAWCAGADLASLAAHPGGRSVAMHGVAELLADLAECPAPVVAVVDGAVLGGGVGLLCAADLAIAGPKASVGLPESSVGVWPMMVGALMARVTTQRVAMDLAVTGRRVGPEEGVRLGFFTSVAEDPGAAADAICAVIVGKSPHATRVGRDAWRRHAGFDADLRARLHALAEALEGVANHPDAAEGISAFFQKRPPTWG